jgi:hypothetical protein
MFQGLVPGHGSESLVLQTPAPLSICAAVDYTGPAGPRGTRPGVAF